MARRPVTGLLSQYAKNAGGASASGYWLKFFSASYGATTSPLTMYTRQSGGVGLSKCKLNTRGEPISDSGDDDSTFIPYIDGDWDAYIFFTEADANVNNTVNSIFLGTNIQPEPDFSTRTLAQFATVEGMVDGDAVDGSSIDYDVLTNNGAWKPRVITVASNSTSGKGGAGYTIWTLSAYRTFLGDGAWVPDGTGSPNYYGRNHYVGGTTYVAILDTESFFDDADGTTEPSNIGPYLNLKVKGLKRSYGIELFDAEDSGITDQSTRLNQALADKYILEVEEGFCGISNITMPSWVEIHGQSKIRSGFRVVGANNGFLVRRYTQLKNLRMIGNSSQTSSNYIVRMGLGTSLDSARSSLIHTVIGGLSTELGDSTNTKYSCVAIGGGNTFLNKFDNMYVHNVSYGYLNDLNSFGGGAFAGVNNALEFAETEFHKCTIGMQFSRPNGVHMNQVTIENCDKQGMICGTPFNLVMTACYFEANNNNNDGSDGNPEADLLFDPSLVGLGSEPGRSCKINGINFLSNESEVNIYAINTKGLDIQGVFDQGTTPGLDLIQIEDGGNGSSGQISDYFSATGRSIVNNSSSFFVTDRVKETVSLAATSGSNGAVHATRTLASAQEVNLVTISSALSASNTNGSIEQYLVGAWEDGTVNITTLMNSQQVASVGCLVQATANPYEYQIKNRAAMATTYRPRIRIERYKR